MVWNSRRQETARSFAESLQRGLKEIEQLPKQTAIEVAGHVTRVQRDLDRALQTYRRETDERN